MLRTEGEAGRVMCPRFKTFCKLEGCAAWQLDHAQIFDTGERVPLEDRNLHEGTVTFGYCAEYEGRERAIENVEAGNEAAAVEG